MFLLKTAISMRPHGDRFVVRKFSCFRSFFDIVEGKFHASSIRCPFFSLLSAYPLHFLYPRIRHPLFQILEFCKFHPPVSLRRCFSVKTLASYGFICNKFVAQILPEDSFIHNLQLLSFRYIRISTFDIFHVE